MAAASARGDVIISHGVTLAADIRNVRTQSKLLKRTALQLKDCNKAKFADFTHKFDSEEEFRVYDVCKKAFGIEKANLKPPCSVTDTNNCKINLRYGFANPNVKAQVKVCQIKYKECNFTVKDATLSDAALASLKRVEKGMSNDKKGPEFAKSFMEEYGSHFQTGNLSYGGYFEYAVLYDKKEKKIDDVVKDLFKSADDLVGSESGLWYRASDILGYKDSDKYELLQKVKMRVTQVGGTSGSNMRKWKEEMERSRSCETLISHASLTPVMDLITQQSQSLKNAEAISKYLHERWLDTVISMPPNAWEQLVELFGLIPYKDLGITLHQVRTAMVENDNDAARSMEDMKNLPWQVLEKLMRMDYRCRDYSLIKGFIEKCKRDAAGKALHSMDVFLLVFASCDILLRQVLVQKMAFCRIAIPFVIPYADGKLEMSLWPLRALTVEWFNKDKKSTEVTLTKHPFNIASFIRFGEQRASKVSKSKLLTDMMSNTSKDTFYNKESAGGNRKRAIAGGLIEMSYYLPSGQSSDVIEKETIILNLRGDGCQYGNQVELLGKISNMVMCFAEVRWLEEAANIDKIASLKTQCESLVVLVVGNDEDEEIEDKLKEMNIASFSNYDSLDECEKSAADLAADLGDTVNEMIRHNKKALIPLVDQKDVFKSFGIAIDEDCSITVSRCEDNVNDIVLDLQRKDPAEAKEQLLPLQGKDLQLWGKLLKKKHRDIKGFSAEETQMKKDKIATSMAECRDAQLRKASPLHSIMKHFIESQEIERDKQGNNALAKRLKLELDDISRSILPGLRQKYQDAWQRKKENPKAYEEAEKRLDDSSFGAEHLLREMGQLYECMLANEDNLTKDQKEFMKKLPELAAKYFINGHSIEIMDGDAGVVPLTWIDAVLGSLEKMIGKKKMFVLAVVGVQSSGKSTLLNTMFGLELAVGAGRCTRGIYGELLEVDKKKMPECHADYVLVIDSEGLCGTVSEEGKYEHDNEIATLVIGLADLTIVNIKGENTQQMKDIFEIAVHAFLRMKAVNNFKKQKCIFLHQSVSAAGAVPQLMHDRHALQDHLDEMTKQSAEVENLSGNISKFSHVIDFDCERNVFYIPDLWNGVPPMGQVSPGYSDKIKEIRKIIVQEMEMCEWSVSPEFMKQRLHDIWSGVLADDFLFSFKNNLSVKAYLLLETEFYKLIRRAESQMHEHLNKKSRAEIEGCHDDTNLQRVFQQEETKVQSVIRSATDECKRKIESFFENSELKQHMQQWRKSKEFEIASIVQELGRLVLQDLRYFHDCKHFEFAKVLIDREAIINQAKTLAESLKGKKYDNKKLEQKFMEIWNTWEKKLKLDQALNISDVKQSMDRAIKDIFKTKAHSKFLAEEMEKKWNHGNGTMEREDLTIADMKKEYISNKSFPEDQEDTSKHWKGTDLVPKKKGRDNFFQPVVKEVNKHVAEVKKELDKMTNENVKFNPRMAHDIIHFIVETVKRWNEMPFEVSEVTLTPQFEAMIAVHVACIATIRFEKLNAKFEKTLSIKAKMEAFKTELLDQFLSIVNENFKEGAAGYLCNKIRQHVDRTIESENPRKAVDKVLQKISFKKHTLMVKVLTSLANKNTFDEYIAFIRNVYKYCEVWVQDEAKKILFNPANGDPEYRKFAKEYLDATVSNLKEGIANAVTEAKQQTQPYPMTQFVNKLKEELKDELVLTENDCQLLQNHAVVDFDGFQRSTSEKIEKIRDDMQLKWVNVDEKNVNWQGEDPYKQVMEKLWGCKEKCPLCLSPCVYTYPNHVADDKPHKCLQHWPAGMSGIRWKQSGKLSTETCNFLISTDSSFSCGASRYKCRETGTCNSPQDQPDVFHKHKDYKKFFQDWEIEEDSAGTATKYWQWVVHGFQKKLAKHYKAKEPDVPREWNIKKEAAIKSLKVLAFDEFGENRDRVEDGEE